MTRRRRLPAVPTAALAEARPTAPPSVQQLLRESDAPAQADALIASAWFEVPAGGEPHSATIRFSGRRVAPHGKAAGRDTFMQEETVDAIMPGSGPVSVTTKVYGIEPGTWAVAAEVLSPVRARPSWLPARPRSRKDQPARPAGWSWRGWTVRTQPDDLATTRWWPLVRLAGGPAVLPGSWTVLAVSGVLAALAVQAVILARQNVPVGPALAASVLGLVAGLLGAKLWYAALHPRESLLEGWAVDGFLVVAPIAAATALLVLGLPIGVDLDASAPGIFLAVALGRVGCFLTGCCAGRPTASRWGVWSSDRRVGMRRVPAQLLESGAGVVLAGLTFGAVLGLAPPAHGLIFVGAFGLYGVLRQILLRTRVEQRTSSRSLHVTAAAAAMSLVAVAAIALLQAG